MAYIANQESVEEISPSAESQEVGECVQHARSRFLDELPGAAFAVMTLLWIVSSFASLIW